MKELIAKFSAPTTFLKNTFSSPSAFIQNGWEQLSKLPGGKQIFSKLVGQYIPYTGSVTPVIHNIKQGHVVVTMKDRRAVRNHLNCVHAIALANLGEFSTGLSLYSQLKNNEKAILVKIDTQYLKKARGHLKSEVNFELPESFQNDADFPITAEIKDEQNNVVTKVCATWRVRVTAN